MRERSLLGVFPHTVVFFPPSCTSFSLSIYGSRTMAKYALALNFRENVSRVEQCQQPSILTTNLQKEKACVSECKRNLKSMLQLQRLVFLKKTWAIWMFSVLGQTKQRKEKKKKEKRSNSGLQHVTERVFFFFYCQIISLMLNS